MPITRHLTSNQENKATLFPLTFKVEENKVALFLLFEANWLRCNHFSILKNTLIGLHLTNISQIYFF